MKRLPWILLGLSLIGNILLGYTWFRDNFSGGKSLRIENEELAALLSAANIRADSLQIKLDETLLEYEALLSQSELLKSERDAAYEDLEAKKIQIRQLIYKASQGDPQALLAANNRVRELESELEAARGRIDLLVREKDAASEKYSETQQMLADVEEARDIILEEHNTLREKVARTKFQVSELKIEPLQEKRDNEVLTYKAGKIDKIKITFVLEKNELLEPGEKEISVRILGTNGEVLGAGNDVLLDSDKLVSMKEKIKYGGEPQDVHFTFKQEEAYKKGIHTIEILSDGEFLTRGSFILN
ncbi:MAG: hypothetical protein H6606_07495 [Flavobacteriales bacterium]|nr:hypothetical protein [Flavobacteriales bacterium]